MYNRISPGKALKATAPFIAVRTMVNIAATLLMILAAIIGFVIMLQGSGVAIVIGIIVFGGGIGAVKWMERYILYLIKAGHIFALTEYIRTGEAPVTGKGYKSVLAFGTEKVKQHFGATNVAFVADTLISKAVNQIMRFLNKIGNFLSFIPGAEAIINIISMIIGIALNYIDEAVLSYIFMKEEEKNPWKKACDAIVYYGQSWKALIKGAVKVAVPIFAARVVFILAGFFIGMGIGQVAGAFIGLFIGYILLYALEKILVDPYASIIMINEYYAAIEGKELQTDLYGKFEKASKKFRELLGRSNEPIQAPEFVKTDESAQA